MVPVLAVQGEEPAAFVLGEDLPPAEMERVVMASGLDWTIARPPKLTNGPLTENYQVEDGRMPHGRIWISRADVAHFLLGELEGDAHTRQVIGMAGT